MVTLAYNIVKIIVTTKITHPRQATPGGADDRVPEPSSIAGEEQRCAATVEEHVAPLRLDHRRRLVVNIGGGQKFESQILGGAKV